MKRIIGFSKIGTYHITNKLPNQDSYLCYKTKEFALIVVSDGLGSKPFSHIGSKAACKSVLEATKSFIKNRTTTSVKDFFEMISVSWIGNLREHKSEECSATCLLALATKNKIFIGRLGDGMICAIGKEQKKDKFFTDSKNGVFANETYSLSNSNLFNLWEYASLDIDDYKSILIATDGISTDLQQGSELEFSKELIASMKGKFWLQKKIILYKLMNNWPVPLHSDDKTIAIMELS